MDDETSNLKQQIIRCRRIASMMTDEDVRESLEALAAEYESRLPKGQGFMLDSRSRDPSATGSRH